MCIGINCINRLLMSATQVFSLARASVAKVASAVVSLKKFKRVFRDVDGKPIFSIPGHHEYSIQHIANITRAKRTYLHDPSNSKQEIKPLQKHFNPLLYIQANEYINEPNLTEQQYDSQFIMPSAKKTKKRGGGKSATPNVTFDNNSPKTAANSQSVSTPKQGGGFQQILTAKLKSTRKFA